MGFRFRKSKKILPGVRLNFSTKSVGVSLGGKHARVSVNSSSRKTYSASILGTGISYVKTSSGKRASGQNHSASGGGYSTPQPSGSGRKKGPGSGWTIFWLIIFFPIGLVMMWMGNWNKKVKIGISAFFAAIFLIGLVTPTDTSDTATTTGIAQSEVSSEIESESASIFETATEIESITETYSIEESSLETAEASATQETENLPETTVETAVVPSSTATVAEEPTQPAESSVSESEVPAAQAESAVTPTPAPEQSAMVYWTPNGKSYHTSSGCSTLSRSKTVLSGTLDEAIAAGKTDPCNVCH
nr:MAG TPA: Protein of unknown function (DUF4236) [Bacteriophage sp.]